jgi:hypothetical protein
MLAALNTILPITKLNNKATYRKANSGNVAQTVFASNIIRAPAAPGVVMDFGLRNSFISHSSVFQTHCLASAPRLETAYRIFNSSTRFRNLSSQPVPLKEFADVTRKFFYARVSLWSSLSTPL